VAASAKGRRNDEPIDQTLVVGDSYTIRAERHGAQKDFTGELLKANDRWIVLRHVTKGRRELSLPLVSKIPLLGDGFRIKGVTPRDEFLWIPREAATVAEHTPAAATSNTQPAVGDEPTLKVVCAVEVARGEQIVRREGGLEVLSDKGLTISIPRKIKTESGAGGIVFPVLGSTPHAKHTENRYTREQHARHDILCIHLLNYETASVALQAYSE
jgi:hypothetical protein